MLESWDEKYWAKTQTIMAENNKKGANVGYIFLFEITSTVCSKLISLPGIA